MAETGLPASEAEQLNDRSWFEHVSLFAERRWPKVGGGQQRSIADAVATATPALLASRKGQPDPALARKAMYGWVCNMTRRDGDTPPASIAATMAWLQDNTVMMSALADQDRLDSVLDLLATLLNGKPASPNTIAATVGTVQRAQFTVDQDLLDLNPLTKSKWTAPEAVRTVDPDVVINPEQAQALLSAVAEQGAAGRHLVAFFGCLYYAALRPCEAVPLLRSAIQLPATGWGEFRLRESAPLSGSKWSDTGRSRDSRQLKHRPRGDVRVVPIAPPLTKLLNDHLRESGTAADGRLHRAPKGGLLGDVLYGAIWHASRQAALTPQEAASLFAALRNARQQPWPSGR